MLTLHEWHSHYKVIYPTSQDTSLLSRNGRTISAAISLGNGLRKALNHNAPSSPSVAVSATLDGKQRMIDRNFDPRLHN